MIGKTLLFVSCSITFYLLLILGNYSFLINIFLALGLGLNMAFIGFNVCHDALHGAYSIHSGINKFFGSLFYLIGANAYIWKITHNKIHHTYTNIVGHDSDLEVAPGLLRISKNDKLKSIYRYQQWYAFFLYLLTSISWFFRKDYIKFFKKSLKTGTGKHAKIEYVKLFGFKTLYYIIFIFLPIFAMEMNWWQLIVLFLVLHFSEGLAMGLIFQLSHLVVQTNMPLPDDKDHIHDSWAVHQMKTTANFARKSEMVSYFLGGLNFQIEHHLFPNVCHVHYPAISKIVKAAAMEFQIPYLENKTFLDALKSHYLFLKRMGRER